jgi:hypothetical protein
MPRQKASAGVMIACSGRHKLKAWATLFQWFAKLEA